MVYEDEELPEKKHFVWCTSFLIVHRANEGHNPVLLIGKYSTNILPTEEWMYVDFIVYGSISTSIL